jgi:hypothetical protein
MPIRRPVRRHICSKIEKIRGLDTPQSRGHASDPTASEACIQPPRVANERECLTGENGGNEGTAFIPEADTMSFQ